jgi:hypothetical protein
MYGTTAIQSVLALPAFDASLNTLQLSFDMYRSSTSGHSPLLVGVMSDPYDITTFDTLAIVVCSQQSTWEHYEIPLSGYTGAGIHLAFCTPGATASYNYIDNITVNTISECAAPTNVAASNITTTTADITWEAGDGDSWIVEYGYAGFVRGTGTIANVSSATFSLTELTPSTGYDVYVYTECSEDTSNYSVRCSFRTIGNGTLPIPFYENFESYGFGSGVRPQGWTYQGYSSSYPYLNASYRNSGSASLYMYCYQSSTATTQAATWIATPEIDTETYPINTLETTFQLLASTFNASTYYPGSIIVGVSSDSSDIMGSFYPVDTVAVTRQSMWQEMEVSFANYPTDSNGRYIVFASIPVNYTGTYAYNYTYIDDIKIDIIPECARPRELVSTGTTESSVSLRWIDPNPEHSAWEVAYGPMGFNPNTMDETMIGDLLPGIFEDSVTVENLSSGVIYDFYVRTDCGSSEPSAWRGPLSASAGGYNIPVAAINQLTLCAATIFDDGGPGNLYSPNANGALTIYPSSPDSVVAVVGGFIKMASSDYVKIFDGTSTYGTPLYNGTGTVNTMDTIRSTSGPLTIQLVSTSSTENDGFALSVACVEAPACPFTQNIEVSSITGRSAYLTWEYTLATLNEPTSFEIEVILEYNGRTFSQFLTYDTEESRQYEMNRFVLALPDCD